MNGGDMNQQQQQQQQQQHQQWVAMQQYQQQWMAMQYPAEAMAMQQQMMYGHHHTCLTIINNSRRCCSRSTQIQNSSEDNKTIWIGDLHQWMDENFLHSHAGEVVSVKIIRNKQTGQSERYGFVEFNTHAAAEKVLQSYNGTMMSNAEQPFRLNWQTLALVKNVQKLVLISQFL